MNTTIKQFKGSYTIEAAFIMPVIIMIILGVIYLGFYMHDYNKILTILNHTSIKTNLLLIQQADVLTYDIPYEKINDRSIFWRYLNDYEEEEEIIKQNITESVIKKGLFISEIEEVNVTINYQKVSFNISAKASIPFVSIKRLFTNEPNVIIKIKTEKEIHDGAEFVRSYEAVKETLSSIEGLNKIIEDFKKLLQKVVSD